MTPPSAESSPWRQWRQEKLRELLPEPPDVDGLLLAARNGDLNAYVRANAIATAIVRLQKWFEAFATAAADAGATDGLPAETILDVARQTEALQEAGCEVVVTDLTARPVVVRAATADEVARMKAARSERPSTEK